MVQNLWRVKAAHPGQIITLWGTGLGAVSGDEAAGPLPGDLSGLDIHVWVGSQEAVIQYRGRSGCCVGVDQIVFVVPNGVDGCYVPVSVQIGDIVSNVGTMAISPSGNYCSNPNGYSSAELSQWESQGFTRIGFISLNRSAFEISVPGMPPFEMASDSGFASFNRIDFDLFALTNGSETGTPPGSCTVFGFGGSEVESPEDPIVSQPLDAGPLININGPLGARQLPEVQGGYFASLSVMNPFLEPGTYTIDNGLGATGDNTVGPFQASIVIGPRVVWTNRDAISSVVRSQGQLITWTGGTPGGLVQIRGSSLDPTGPVGAAFFCTADAAAGSFTIPPNVLLSLPPSTLVNGAAIDFLLVGISPPPTEFQAPGLDLGLVQHGDILLKNVEYQ